LGAKHTFCCAGKRTFVGNGQKMLKLHQVHVETLNWDQLRFRYR
jgi:hypothetical protein